MILHFNTPQSISEAHRFYQHRLDKLPFLYENLNVETSFGNTRILLTGIENKPSLVVIYGLHECPLESLIGLMNDFRVYAIDVMDQPDLRKENGLSMHDNSYGQWMFELLAWLNIRDAILVGISFGGFVCLKTLVLDDRHISQVFLITPAGIVNGCILKNLWRIWLPMRLYKWHKDPSSIHQFLEGLFTEHNRFTLAFFSKVHLNFKINFSHIPLIKKEEAQKIKKPIHIIAAEKDLLFPGVSMLKRAKAIFPSLGEILLLKNSKHVPNPPGYEQIVKFIGNPAQ